MDVLKTYLQQRLRQELPGEIAHQEVAPYRKVDYDRLNVETARKSAVLILLYLKHHEPHITLIQRPVYDGAHSGQIAFPGGKVEKEDTSIVHTALREANEEVGIITNDVDVLGQLTDVYIPVSNFLVSPIIGSIDYAPNFIPEPAEVADIIEMNVSYLTATEKLIPQKLTLSTGLKIEVPTFQYQQKTIWGATALMLNELRWLLKEL